MWVKSGNPFVHGMMPIQLGPPARAAESIFLPLEIVWAFVAVLVNVI